MDAAGFLHVSAVCSKVGHRKRAVLLGTESAERRVSGRMCIVENPFIVRSFADECSLAIVSSCVSEQY